jgi:hypothetical protein
LAQDKITRCLGLVAQYNPLAMQPGALSKANDILIRRENVVEDRRGHKLYGTLGTQPAQMMSFAGVILAHRGTAVSYDNGSGTFTDYSGSYSAISGQKMRFTEQFSNLYTTTSLGIKVFSDAAGTIARSAGVARCLDPSYSLNAASTGFLAAAFQCAYRAALSKTDANLNVIRGYPSTRLWVTNPSYTYTANATAASTTISGLSGTTGLIVGQSISGLGIPSGTTVVSITSTTIVMSAAAVLSVTPTANSVSGSTQVVNLSSTSGIQVGMTITGAGIPANTTISALSGTTITLNNQVTSTTNAASVTCSVSGSGISFAFSSSRNVDMTMYLPAEAAVGDVVEFYRTAQVSGTASDASGDEEALVYQYTLTSTDISNGYVTFTDSITDALRGASLYTSPSQEGIAQANDRPPLARDVASFKQFMLYGNTSTKQRLFITLVGTSGLSGHKVVIASTTYSFGSTESFVSSATAAVGATGVASVDIDTTARSLVRIINRFASNTSVYAYYLTGPSDLPGQIMIEERGVGASAYTVQAVDSTIQPMFFPAPPISPSTNSKSTSSNSVQKNAVYYAKFQQGEHVPTLNYLLVGPSNKNILRIAPLRDSCIVIKEEGVYRIAGQDPTSFTVVPIDLTVFCRSADSVVVLGNQVYMLSNQGVVAISDTAVQVISRDIEQLIQPLLTFSNIGIYTTGTAYESERSYFLSTMSSSVDTAQTQTFVYNYFTKTWVRHSYAMVAGVIGTSDDKMYFAKPSNLNVFQERKSFTDSDYADPEYSITIVSITGSTARFTLSGTTPIVGWAVSQGGISIAISSFITNSVGNFTAVLASTPPATWSAGAATLYPSVGTDFAWHSWTGEAPDMLKQVRQVGILADDESSYNTVTSLLANFTSNFDGQIDSVTLTSPGLGWGAAWGATPWGGQADTAGYPTYVPKNKQYCTRLQVGVQHPTALERMSVTGCAFAYEPVSERIGR